MTMLRSVQVCADCGFVLVAKSLVHILVHQGGLPDPEEQGIWFNVVFKRTMRVKYGPTITKDDNLRNGR